MFVRKFITVMIGTIVGLTVLLSLLSLLENGALSFWNSLGFVLGVRIWFSFRLLLYGIIATILSDYVTKKLTGWLRASLALIIHSGFGLLFGIIFPSNIESSLFSFEVDRNILLITGVFLFIWAIDELVRKKIAKPKTLLFATGAVLFFITIPYTTITTMEFIMEKQMNQSYAVKSYFDRFPPPQPSYTIGDKKITIEEKLPGDVEPYMDPWKNRVILGDITVLVNGKELDTLENYPIRIDYEGLGRYYGQLSLILMEEHPTDKERLIVMLKDTRETPKEIEGVRITGQADHKDLEYTYYQFDEVGNMEKESFNFNERDHYQTFLLRHSSLAPYGPLRYYGEHVYSFGFPIFTIIGGILAVYYQPFRKRKKVV